MPKEKTSDPDKKSSNEEGVIWSVVMESLKIIFIEGLKNFLNNMMDIINARFEQMQKKMMMYFGYIFLVGLSAIFFSIALIKLLEQYLSISSGWSYFIVGALVLGAALIINSKRKNVGGN